MIQLNRGNWLYWLATLGGYVEDARTENLFNFGFHVIAGILLVLLRTLLALFILSPLLFTFYWLGQMVMSGSYIEPYDLLKFGWYIYGAIFIVYSIYALFQSIMCPAPTQTYKVWRKISRFFFRVKTNKAFAISFLNRDDE